jgi:hypothetical protein
MPVKLKSMTIPENRNGGGGGSRYFVTKMYGNDKRPINESIEKMLKEKNIDY